MLAVVRSAVMVATLACLAAAPEMAGCKGSHRPRSDERGPAAALRLIPDEAVYVVGVDVAQVRAAPISARLGGLRVVFGPLAKSIDDFPAKTGIDPWQELDSITVAGLSSSAELAVVFRGRRFDDPRLEAYARARLAAEGDELVSRQRGRRTLWSARKSPRTTAIVLDGGTLVLATPGWAAWIADLADGVAGAGSATSNAELAAACAQVSGSPVWAAGAPPDEARQVLQTDLSLRGIASLRRLTLAVDLAPTFTAKVAADFADGAQADQLAEEVAQSLDRERRARGRLPFLQAVFKGLTEYTDGTTVRAELQLDNDVLVGFVESAARVVNLSKPVGELPQPTLHALTLKPDWLAPPPENVALSEVRSYDAWDRRTHALLEVTNRGEKPVLPEIVIRYRDANEKRLDERLCLVPMFVLLPHESAGCDPGVPASAASGIYTIRTAPDARAAAFASGSRTTLKVLGAQLEPARGAVQWLAGQVKNDAPRPVQGARVHATFYDADHKIVGYGDASLPRQPIAPGASVPFRLASGPLFAPGTSFAAIAYAIDRPPPKR